MMTTEQYNETCDTLHAVRYKALEAMQKLRYQGELAALEFAVDAFADLARVIDALRIANGLSLTDFYNRSKPFHKYLPMWLEVLRVAKAHTHKPPA